MAAIPEMTPVDDAHALFDLNRIHAPLVQTGDGYLDVLGGREFDPPTLPQRSMQSPMLSWVYEGLWRPVFSRMFSFGSGRTSRQTEAALCAVLPAKQGKVLDVACGPGLYTRRLARDLPEGLTIGFDVSKPMLRQATRKSSGLPVAFVRGDAHELPYSDATFDSVICLAALYLIPQPHQVIAEMARVLKPDGRILIWTSLDIFVFRPKWIRRLIDAGGWQLFTRNEVTDSLDTLDLTEIEQTIIGAGQFVTAKKST
jgi:ubiquinone/menaquinone biosynthesis C-methylase UbiE